MFKKACVVIRVLVRGFYCGEDKLALKKGLTKSVLEQIFTENAKTQSICIIVL